MTRNDADTLNRLKSIRNQTEVEEFLAEEDLSWQPLGQQNNNVGIIRSGSNPANALTERITNGIDAVIERQLEESDIDMAQNPPANPREAVVQMLDLGSGGFHDLSRADLLNLGEDVSVTLKESGKKTRPVIEIADAGIGQKPENFHTTFVGLNEDNKITKPYLIGKYGQGGSNTFDFAEYVVIISRSHEGGDIGWTIVRFNDRLDTDEEFSDGVYEYCTLPNGDIPSISEEHADGWSGSLVRLIEYDAGKFSTIITGPTSSLYWATHMTMFGAIYPFTIHDQRTERYESLGDGETRRVLGNRFRLDNSDLVEDERKFSVDVGNLGEVNVNCWILRDSDKTENFAERRKPVVFTLVGQTHHTESKHSFIEKANHGFLKDRLVIEVDCDNLTPEGTRIFSSTRDRAVDTREYREIKNKIVKTLKNDDKLKRLNKKYKERAMKEKASEEEEKAREILADLLESYERGKDSGRESSDEGDLDEPPTTGPSTGGTVTEPEPVPDLKDYPTFLEIENPGEPIEAKQGRTLRVRVKTNAKDGFEVLNRGEFRLELSGLGDDEIDERSQSRIKDGRLSFQIDISSNCSVGTEATLTAIAEWENGQLEDQREMIVVEPPKTKKSGSSGVQYPTIESVSADHQETIDILGWDESSVAFFDEEDDGAGTVFVSLFNKNISPILQSVDKSEGTLRRYKSQYSGYVAFYEVLREQQNKDREEVPDEGYIEDEKNRIAEVLMHAIAKNVDPTEIVGGS